MNGHPATEPTTGAAHHAAIDLFYVRVVEHAVAYFGSRVLYPSRAVAESECCSALSRAACEKAAQAAVRGEEGDLESSSREWGYRIGNQIYDAYLGGKIAPAGLRRLFLTHLDEPGLARKVCATIISKLRAIARPQARAAHV